MRFRNKGFSTLEMVIAAGIIMMMGYIYSQFLRRDVVNQEGNQLATQTLSYAKTYAKYLNDLQSGNIYIMGSGNNCVEYNPFMSGNTVVISLTDLAQNFGKRDYDPDHPALVKCTSVAGSYKNSILNEKNSFQQTPCLGVTKNTAGKLQAFMFYVDTGANTTNLDYVRSAMLRLNGKAGYFESNGTIRSGGGWSLSSSDPRFADPGHCGGTRISPNSLVINMNQFIEFNDQLSNSVALNRESDVIHKPGTSQNTNTSKTDIYMSNSGVNHQIVFDKSNNVTMSTTSGSTNTVAVNGDVYASSLQGTKQVVSGSACNASQVGAMAQQADPNARSLGIQQGEAICTDSSLVCALYGTRYCWLPAKGNTITYNDAAHTGKLTNRLICPAYAPFMTYAKGFQQGNNNVTIENIITPVTNPNTGQTYNLARGAKALGDNSPVGCKTWSYSVAYGANNWGRASCSAGSTYQYPGNCGLTGGFAACDGTTKNGNKGWYGVCTGAVQIGPYNCANAGCAGKDWICTEQGVTPPVMLETVTCTSKLVIQAS